MLYGCKLNYNMAEKRIDVTILYPLFILSLPSLYLNTVLLFISFTMDSSFSFMIYHCFNYWYFLFHYDKLIQSPSFTTLIYCRERWSVGNGNSDMIVNENEESIVKEIKSKTVFKYNEGRLRMKSGYKIVTSILSSVMLYLSLHPYNMMFLSN